MIIYPVPGVHLQDLCLLGAKRPHLYTLEEAVNFL